MTLDDLQIKVLDKAKSIAIKSLKNFFRINDLDPSLFNHLYEIDFKIENCKSGLAEFDPRKFKIMVDAFYVDDMIDELMYCETEKETKNVYLNIAVTLVHEMLHANRTILIEKGVHSKIFELYMDAMKNEIKGGTIATEIEIDYYQNLLNQILEKPFSKEFKLLVPIKIKIESDNQFTVVAYDRKEKDFLIFKNQKFSSKFNGNADEFLKNIGIELNVSNNHVVDEIIADTFTTKSSRLPSFLPMDFYHKYDKTKKLETLDSIKYMVEKVNYQSDFEEVISDTIASIVIISRNDDILDLKKINDSIQNKDYPIDEKLCMKIINNEGLDIIKWFLTSSYKAEYYDKFENIFNDNYMDILRDFSKIYNSIKNDEEPSLAHIEDANSIIEQKKKKSK